MPYRDETFLEKFENQKVLKKKVETLQDLKNVIDRIEVFDDQQNLEHIFELFKRIIRGN